MDDDPNGNESGGALRVKLEEALKANAEQAAAIVAYEAKNVIAASGYKHVTAADLVGIPLTELATKAAEFEAKAAGAAEQLLRSALGQSVPADQLDATIASLLGKSGNDEASAAAARLQAVSTIQGLPSAGPDVSKMDGPQKIQHWISTTKP